MDKVLIDKNFSSWIFDLDDTLYPHEENIFVQVKQKITEFISKDLNLNLRDADIERKRLYSSYGTSLRGLMTERNVNPKHFLEFVHDIDLTVVKENPELNQALKNIRGHKIIFTNGSFKHAEKVLERLGIKGNFSNIHSIETSNYIPKPSVEAYYNLIRKENIISKKSIMFEDTAWNLKTAKDLGMTTVLISPKNHLLENNKSDYIDYNITDLVKFLK